MIQLSPERIICRDFMDKRFMFQATASNRSAACSRSQRLR
ncbi:hypothetical protein SynPROS91_01567 [Synechococcus sp. PROS-9-1]|nr:hypothetical protein SynPROS91_01567 [Synechococcus sp. PROS-9-1]